MVSKRSLETGSRASHIQALKRNPVIHEPLSELWEYLKYLAQQLNKFPVDVAKMSLKHCIRVIAICKLLALSQFIMFKSSLHKYLDFSIQDECFSKLCETTIIGQKCTQVQQRNHRLARYTKPSNSLASLFCSSLRSKLSIGCTCICNAHAFAAPLRHYVIDPAIVANSLEVLAPTG